MKISEQLVLLREKRGLTQAQISDELEVKRARYNAWEQGLSQPNIEMITKIAEFHNVSTDYLIGKSEMKNAEIDRKEDLDQNFRVIQRAAMEMSPEQREKAIEMWDFLFNEVLEEAKKQEGVIYNEGDQEEKS